MESALSGVEKTFLPEERLWYRRTFTVSPELKGSRKVINFGAVDQSCKVFINRGFAGEHTGGYAPFSFDITDLLRDGENELIVFVSDPTEHGHGQRGKQVLHSNGFWYTATSGIWQTVWLESFEPSHIKGIRILPDTDGAKVDIKINAAVAKDAAFRAEVTLAGKTVFRGSVDENAAIPLPDFRYWSPEDPVLYGLSLELIEGGKTVDAVRSYFGMRKFSIEMDADGLSRLCLNGKPYFQRGLLDQGYFPDGGLTPPTDQAMIDDIMTAKKLGFNMLRKHIKVEPERWYYHCDRLGILVWQDMVSGGEYIGNLTAGILPFFHVKLKDDDYKRFSRDKLEWRDEFRSQLREMVNALFNHTCICTWVPFNEGWGQFDSLAIANRLKEYDPSRFVDHASGWYDQGGPDLKSMHKYIVPIRLPKLDTRPFVISEYGGYSRVIDDHVWNKAKSFGYKMYTSEGTLSAAYKKLHDSQVIPLIKKGLCATVYTQLTNVEFEVNGIMTYDRELVKLDEDTVRDVNSRLTY